MEDDSAPDSKTIAKDVVDEFLVDMRYQNMLKGLLSEVMDEKIIVVNNRLKNLKKDAKQLRKGATGIPVKYLISNRKVAVNAVII